MCEEAGVPAENPCTETVGLYKKSVESIKLKVPRPKRGRKGSFTTSQVVTSSLGVMFRLPINGTLAQGQLVPTWSIRIICYSDKYGDCDIPGEPQHTAWDRKVYLKKKRVWSEILLRNLCKGNSGALCVGGKLHSSIRAGICSATWHLCRCTRAVGWLMRRPTLCWHMHTAYPHQYLTQTRTLVRLSWSRIRTCRLQMKLLAHTCFHT